MSFWSWVGRIDPKRRLLQRSCLEQFFSECLDCEATIRHQIFENILYPPHHGIGGMVPAQMATIPMDLTGNRWMTMIGLAVKYISNLLKIKQKTKLKFHAQE